MKRPFLLSFFFLFSTLGPASEKKLGLFQSKLFQLTSSGSFQEWLIHPSYSKKGFSNKTLFLFSKSSGFFDFYNHLRTKDSQKIITAISNSVGTANTLMYKIEGVYKKGLLNHSFSYNSGQFLFIDPSNSQMVDGLFYSSIGGKLYSKFVFPSLKVVVVPKITYGLRKSLDQKFSSAELVLNQPDQALGKMPWKIFSELNILTNINLKFFDLSLNLQSFPLLNTDFIFWDFSTGVQSKKIPLFKKGTSFDFFVNFSPYVGGNYEKKRTMRYGSSLHLNRKIRLNIFLLENSKLGLHLAWKSKNLSASIHSYEMLYSNSYSIKKNGVDFKYRF